MKLYLVNKNPIISKLVALSASKLGVEVEESQEIDTSLSAEIVLIDDECFEQELFDAYKAGNSEAKFGLFYAKSAERLEGFNEYIQKPFLPTDLVKTLSKISGITPIDSHQVDKGNDSELALDGVESLDNLDEELDLSSFDDLQLDDEAPATESSAGDEQLDFGADEEVEEGIEEAADSNAEEQPEEGIEEAITEDPNEQLDFGADDSEEESQDLNVLDKGDVDEIKDLLSSEESAPKQEEELLDLGKEFESGGDSSANSDLEFGDLQAELDNLEVAEETKEEGLESEDIQLEGLESEDVMSNNADFKDMGGGIDFSQTTEDEGFQDLSDLTEQAAPEEEKTDINLDDFSSEINLEETQDLGDFSQDSSESAPSNAAEELGDLELTEPTNELQDSDFGSLELSNDLEMTEETSVAKSDLDSSEDLGEMTDFNDSNMESQEEQIALDVGLEDEPQVEALEDEPVLEANAGDLEIPEGIEDDLDLTAQENINVEEMESEVSEPQPQSNSLEAGIDEFDSLSIEGMSEALGEPIAKAPNPAPIVPNTDSVSESALPSSIQANSLESLISALQGLQGQNLKDLLGGATISINIQFPKKD